MYFGQKTRDIWKALGIASGVAIGGTILQRVFGPTGEATTPDFFTQKQISLPATALTKQTTNIITIGVIAAVAIVLFGKRKR